MLLDVAAGPEPEAIELPNWDDCAARLLEVYKEVIPTR